MVCFHHVQSAVCCQPDVARARDKIRIGIALLSLSLLLAATPLNSWAQEGNIRSAVRNPIVKQAAIGAGVGAIGGVISDRSSVLKGAGVGALTGAGTGLIDSSSTLRGRPLIRNTAKGAVIGTGASTVFGRSKLGGAAGGAAVGAGYQLFKDYMRD